VVSFRSFGSRRQRSARPTISRNRIDPRTPPLIDRPQLGASNRLPITGDRDRIPERSEPIRAGRA
jgi:hypothetical protein